jgi:beta-lactamase regulating signal transducer with metallopeptidase domain
MTGWLLGNLLWSTVLMLLVLAVRQPAARLLGAGPAYALWLIPALRLLAPPPTLLAAPSLIPSFSFILEAGGGAAAPLPPVGGPGQWVPILLALWAGGAAIFLAWQWLLYRAFLTRLSLASRSAGSHGGIPLVMSPAVEAPLAVGLLDRRIVLPADFAGRYSAGERRLALDHELVHHRRGDIWWNLFALLVLALNWFNPVAWIAFRAFRADQELACDATVAGASPLPERLDYARALVKSASRPGLVGACPLNHADQLKRRLRMIKDHRSSRARTLVGLGAVAALGLATFGLGSPGFAHPDDAKGEKRERHMVIMKGEGHGKGHAMHMGGHPRKCEEGGQVADLSDEADGKKMRMLLCARGDATAEERIRVLEEAKSHVAESDRLDAAHRQRIAARIDGEIARLRGN